MGSDREADHVAVDWAPARLQIPLPLLLFQHACQLSIVPTLDNGLDLHDPYHVGSCILDVSKPGATILPLLRICYEFGLENDLPFA